MEHPIDSFVVRATQPEGLVVAQESSGRWRATWNGEGNPGSVRIDFTTGFPADRVYVHGYGTASPGQIVPLADPVAGHSCVALVDAERCLTVEIHDHRDYGTTIWVAREGEDIAIGVCFDTAGAERVGRLPAITVRESARLHDGLVRFANETAKVMEVRPPGPAMRAWCSWYYHFQNFDEATLDAYLDGFAALPDDVRPEVVQIDAGYFPACGDWLEANFRWPSGMAAAAEKIRAKGFRAGIWIGPFMVGNRSRLFREHPEWMLRDESGGLVTEMRMYGEQRLWGLPDEEYHVLDGSHPGAAAHLDTVFRQLREWGFDYFKTDFMYWGFRSSAGLVRHAPGSGTQHLRRTLDLIRKAIGPESTWLACIAPFAPFLGYADAMRVGGDVVPDWNGGSPNEALVRLLPGAAHMNGIWWLNDPDAVILRDFHTFLTPAEAHALTMWQGVHAGVLNTSDPLHLVGEDRLGWWRELCALATAPPASPVETAAPFLAARRGDSVWTLNPTSDDDSQIPAHALTRGQA